MGHPSNNQHSDQEEEENDGFDADSVPELSGPKASSNHTGRNRRQSVSAEVASDPTLRKKINLKNHVPKTKETQQRIRNAMKNSFLFAELEEEQANQIVEAMFERKVSPDDVVIKEGDTGDNFYIIDSGKFTATKKGEVVFNYEDRGHFGELALMYNAPRAATVTAANDGVLWALERMIFRELVVNAMAQRRERYESILEKMSVFSGLSSVQRGQIADCLATERFGDGELILEEGEDLTCDSKFYIIDAGSVECFKSFSGTSKMVKTLNAGEFFGEYALVKQIPRQADCRAKGELRLLSMTRDAFQRIMGPIDKILHEKILEYNDINTNLTTSFKSLAI